MGCRGALGVLNHSCCKISTTKDFTTTFSEFLEVPFMPPITTLLFLRTPPCAAGLRTWFQTLVAILEKTLHLLRVWKPELTESVFSNHTAANPQNGGGIWGLPCSDVCVEYPTATCPSPHVLGNCGRSWDRPPAPAARAFITARPWVSWDAGPGANSTSAAGCSF